MGLLTDEGHEKVERAFAFLTGNHFINYHYGAILSKSLKVLPVRDFDAQEIAPNLFLGDVYAAHNPQELKKRNITHILTCTVGVIPPWPESFKYLHLKILDCAAETIHEHFAETAAFIAEAIEGGGKVLVHCIRGVSRSATIVSAYLMTSMKMSAEAAVEHVKSIRPIARPNYGFMIQLQMYGKQLQNGGLSVTVSEDIEVAQAERLSPKSERKRIENANENENEHGNANGNENGILTQSEELALAEELGLEELSLSEEEPPKDEFPRTENLPQAEWGKA